MPGYDRTGPQGMGPLTGRRMGYCAGNEGPDPGAWPGYRFRGGRGNWAGRGPGRGFGRGYGYGWGGPARDLSSRESIEQEMKILKNELSFLEKKLSEIEKKDD